MRFFLLLFSIVQLINAQNYFFQNKSKINDFMFLVQNTDNHVLIGTNGGMVDLDVEKDSYHVINLTQGLLSLKCTAGQLINQDHLVVGSNDGLVNLFKFSDYQVISYSSVLSPEKIEDIAIKNDTIWVLSTRQLAVYHFVDDKLKFIDSFKNFGGSDFSLKFVTLHGSWVFVGINDGVMYAPSDISTFNLKDFGIWKVLNKTDSGVLTGTRSAVKLDSVQYILADDGMYRVSDDQTIVAEKINSIVTSVVRQGIGNEWYLSNKRIVDLSGQEFIEFPEIIKDFMWLDETLVAITGKGKLYSYHAQTGLDSLSLMDFPSDFVGKIIKSKGNDYYAAGSPAPFYVNKGLVRWNDNSITHYYWDGRRWFNRTRFVKEILPGKIITGTWGAGFWIIDESTDSIYSMNSFAENEQFSLTKTTYTEKGVIIEQMPKEEINLLPSVLSVNTDFGGDRLSFISDADFDPFHQMLWVTQFAVKNNKGLIGFPVKDGQIRWDDSTNIVQINVPGVVDQNLTAVEVDLWGNIWIGSALNGLFRFDYDRYVAGSSGFKQFLEGDGLASNAIIDIETDNDGYVWIGTSGGTNVYTGSQLIKLREDYQPIGLTINDIFIDEMGNRWFSTDKGVSTLRGTDLPWQPDGWFHFVSVQNVESRTNTNFTNIPAEGFYGTYVDYDKNEIFIGTLMGLLLSQHLPGLPAKDHQTDLVIFPNPARLGEGQDYVTIKNVMAASLLKILDPNGKLIRELNMEDKDEFNGFWGIWDGKDEEGKMVASGVYLIISLNNNGESQIGKLFLIR